MKWVVTNSTTNKIQEDSNKKQVTKKIYSQATLQRAVEAIKRGMSQKHAAETFQIPRSTLQFKMKFPDKKNRPGPRTVLTENEELLLEAWLIKNSLDGYPKRKEDLLYRVAQIINKNQRPNPFKNGVPGQTWYKRFLKRHPDIVFTDNGVFEVNS